MLTDDYDPYADPGAKLAADMACDDTTRGELMELEERYAAVPKAPVPNAAVGDW